MGGWGCIKDFFKGGNKRGGLFEKVRGEGGEDKHPLRNMVLEANEKQVPRKTYSLEERISSVNQILKNKEKVS